MKPFFSSASLKLLKSLSNKKILFAFDFDGTLTKIVSAHKEVYLSASTEKLMKTLCHSSTVAIISGRGLKDLKQRLTFKPQFVIGNHGLESPVWNKKERLRAKKAVQKWKKILVKSSFPKGVEIEDKNFSLTLHFRQTKNKLLARKQIRDVVKKLTPQPRIVGGKMLVNLLPPNAPNKGSALLHLLKKIRHDYAVYVGDDLTDEDVFTLKSQKMFTIRVGKRQNSAARFYIHRQSDINQLLIVILDHFASK